MSEDILDWKDALTRVLNKRDLYVRLLKKFMETEQDATARINAALQSGDIEAACRMAHTVKGTAANLGGKALAAAALELEMALKGGADITLPLKRFEGALTDTLVEMSAFMAG